MTTRRGVRVPDAAQHHKAEQNYALASAHLDGVLNNIRGDMDIVAVASESHDPSALFDYVFSILRTKNRSEPGSFLICELMCAAALVRLATAPKSDDPLENIPTPEGEPWND